MEEIKVEKGTIRFPNKYLFAFNPNYIELELDEDVPYVDIDFNQAFTVQCSLYKGKGRCYISRLLQLSFSDNYLRCRCLDICIGVGYNGTYFEQKDFVVIWGCIRLGDPFGLGETITKFPTPFPVGMKHVRFLREVKWYKKFPFTVSFFMPYASNYILTAKVDGSEEVTVNPGNAEIFEVTPPKEAVNSIFYNINLEKELLESTFPTIFDDTFSKTYKFVDESVKVTISNETEGYYLRWIDQFGFIQYWLFKKGDITHKNKLGSITKSVDKLVNGIYYGNVQRVTSIENTETLKCAAINLNENMVRTVETIIKSPYVDRFLGYNQN